MRWALFKGLGKQQQTILYRLLCLWSSHSTVFTSQWDCDVSRIRRGFIFQLCLSAAEDGNRVFDLLGLSVFICNMDIRVPSYPAVVLLLGGLSFLPHPIHWQGRIWS